MVLTVAVALVFVVLSTIFIYELFYGIMWLYNIPNDIQTYDFFTSFGTA